MILKWIPPVCFLAVLVFVVPPLGWLGAMIIVLVFSGASPCLDRGYDYRFGFLQCHPLAG